MEQLEVNITITYDEDKKQIVATDLSGNHSLRELSIIISAFRNIVYEFDDYELPNNKIK